MLNSKKFYQMLESKFDELMFWPTYQKINFPEPLKALLKFTNLRNIYWWNQKKLFNREIFILVCSRISSHDYILNIL